mmetsp:Transcript_17389/g.30345  ORF Transcript_17389/g.30345 Transcript_17389/m.30345 type:complete len:100 (+) Transcript_17389:752-1051(+)
MASSNTHHHERHPTCFATYAEARFHVCSKGAAQLAYMSVSQRWGRRASFHSCRGMPHAKTRAVRLSSSFELGAAAFGFIWIFMGLHGSSCRENLLIEFP